LGYWAACLGTITVKVPTNGLSGQIQKFINVETNDPDHSRIKLDLTGEVRKFTSITPSKAVYRAR